MNLMDHLTLQVIRKFNATGGRNQGDRVLQAVAKIFQGSPRKHDTTCRRARTR
ncbi:MAG: diguanylate cyclase [Dechloromonas sp.]|jgi:GGDEF domain-containing protein|nr:diguanylate cyclase [Candidatus Dechloromonas phosphoritropha]MBP9229437.1 diguanylate cyclase [Azonexus sp.]